MESTSRRAGGGSVRGVRRSNRFSRRSSSREKPVATAIASFAATKAPVGSITKIGSRDDSTNSRNRVWASPRAFCCWASRVRSRAFAICCSTSTGRSSWYRAVFTRWPEAPEPIARTAISSDPSGTTKMTGRSDRTWTRDRRTSRPEASRSLEDRTTAWNGWRWRSRRPSAPVSATDTRKPRRPRAATLRTWCSSFPSTTRIVAGSGARGSAVGTGAVWTMGVGGRGASAGGLSGRERSMGQGSIKALCEGSQVRYSVRYCFRAAHTWSSARARDGLRDLEAAVLPREDIVPGLVARGPHLHDPQAALDVEVRGRVHPDVHDPVREVRLVGRVGGRAQVEGPLGDEDREGAEVPEPLEQEVQVRAPVLHLRHRLEDVEGVDDEDGDRVRLHHVVAVHLEELEPGPAALEEREVLPNVPHVEEGQAGEGLLVRHPQGGHVLEEEVLPLLEGEVRALAALLEGVLVQDREREGGLHRPGRAGQEDDEPLRDAALKGLVEAGDVGLDPVPLHGVGSGLGRGDPR